MARGWVRVVAAYLIGCVSLRQRLPNYGITETVMVETHPEVNRDRQRIDAGYRNCRAVVKRYLKPHLWLIGNLSGDRRRGMDVLLSRSLTVADLLDLESTNGLSLDVWHEIRDELSDAFSGRPASSDLAALVDTCQRYGVPRQFLFDPLRGADLWIRSRQFETYQELEAFCSYVGGASLASMVPVVGHLKEGYELAAIAAGKAVMLTQILANCVDDMKHNRMYLAREDLDHCQVDVPRLKMRRPSPEIRYLVRLYTSRLEAMFATAESLIAYLDYDGRRCLTSLLGWHWKLMTQMQRQPELILREEGVLTPAERMGIRSRHLLGIEPALPFATPVEHHH